MHTTLCEIDNQQRPTVYSTGNYTHYFVIGWEDPLEKEMATHSSIFAWEIPWTESLEGYSPWGHKRVGHD